MKQIILVVSLLLTVGCATPGYISKMDDASKDMLAGTQFIDSKDYEGAIQKLTSAIDEAEIADSLYKERCESCPDVSNWRVKYFAVILGGRILRSEAYSHLKKSNEANNDANWVIGYYNKNGCKEEDIKKFCIDAVEHAVFFRGDIYRVQGNYHKAIEDYNWVVKNGGDLDWTAYEMIGLAYLGLQDLNTAYKHFDTLVKHDPNYAQAYALRCFVGYEIFKETNFKSSKKDQEQKEKKLHAVQADCFKAKKLDPKNKLATKTLMRVVFGNITEEQNEEFRKAIEKEVQKELKEGK